MCAINGFTFPDEELIKKMNKKTAHRGPDDSGVFLDGKVTFGHNRLSIIDPSPSAHQPMKSKDGNVVVILNGEIYNFRELKEELDSSYSFKTESDTEVIIAAWEKWGTECVKRFNGIFSLALWDKRKETLFLARDHAGIKPLYYYLDGERLIFSSEIKGILEHNIPRNIDYEALGHYFRLLYVPAPHTLFKNVLKFPPAHYAIFKEGKLEFMKYWDESENSSIKNKDELLEKTKAVITESVKRQLVSDKPLGVYLSGGLDSSIILHSMSEKHVDIDTFSVGFELSKEEQADKFNADFFLAKRTAKHYGTKHHEILLSPSDVVELFGESVWHSDEPIANPTALARLKIARFAKENVDVVLAGDGGDELFGGYDRYRLSHAADLWQKYTPGIIRSLLSVNERLRKLNTPPGVSRYGLFMFQKNPVLKEVLKDEYINTTTANYFEERYFKASQDDSFTHNFLFADRKSWLVDESLILSDKMSMASGIEMRVPFLDPEVIQFSQSVPEHLKVSSFDTKILLKEAYRSSLPEYLFKEPKRGWFSPSAKWLRNEDVYEFAKEVLSSGYYKETENIFKWEGVQSMLEDHRARKRYNLSILWALMVFQVWARRFDVSG